MRKKTTFAGQWWHLASCILRCERHAVSCIIFIIKLKQGICARRCSFDQISWNVAYVGSNMLPRMGIGNIYAISLPIIFFPSSHIYCCNNIISCEMIFTKNIYRVHSVWRGIQNEENERRHKRRLYFGWKRILETEITHPERGSLITISIFALPPSFQKNQSSKITKPGADKSNQY